MQHKINTETYSYSLTKEGAITNLSTRRVLQGWVGKAGYREFTLGNSRYLHHRLLANAFIPNPHNLPEVNHLDGNKLNNALSNLEWVTTCSNIRHAFTNKLTKQLAIIDYNKIPTLLEKVFAGESISALCNQEGLQETSALRKLLLREAIRQGKKKEFKQGTAIARQELTTRQSTQVYKLSVSGEVLEEFPSMAAAGRYVGKTAATIFKVLDTPKLCGGFYWRR